MSFDALLWDWRFQASEEAKSQSHAAPGKTIATRGSAYLIYEFDISQGCRSAAAIVKTWHAVRNRIAPALISIGGRTQVTLRPPDRRAGSFVACILW
jgi:hypothetical protein